MTIEITEQAFDPYTRLSAYERELTGQGRYGAQASFIGYMRDQNEGQRIHSMLLEHYPGMTERHLEAIADEANRRWQLEDTLIVHRVGRVHIGEAIVLVAVWSAHRAAAFEACRYIMEDLKSRAPFWKKETLDEGERWVKHNTPGYSDLIPGDQDNN